MRTFYRLTGTGAISCAACLDSDTKPLAVKLEARLFPGTYHLLSCAACGATGGEAASRHDAAPTPGDGPAVEEPC